MTNRSHINGPFQPQGVDNDTPGSSEGYFVGVDIVFDKLHVRRISNPGGTPSISANLVITTPTTCDPIDQVQSGSTKKLWTVDKGLYAAMIKKNKITGVSSLWTAHNILVNSSGTGTCSGDRNAMRWYQLDNLTSTPTLAQSGTLFDSSVTNPRGYWMGSVAASGQGHMAMISSFAGNADFAGVVASGRLSTDSLGATQTPTVVVSGSGPFDDNVGIIPLRWGPYSQVTVDPNDDQTMWGFEEFTYSTSLADNWGVRAVKLIAPPPATPATASPSSIPVGTASQNVTITGASISGSGFFDPGTGFANRLAVSVSGGATVNSVTFTDATHITVNISTVGATGGTVNVTITNPDGQQVVATNFIALTCGYSILSTGETFGNAGGAGSVDVTTTNGCLWNVANVPAWATTTSGGSGGGPGTWTYLVAANVGQPRTQLVTIAGQSFALSQLSIPTKTSAAGRGSQFSLADASAENWTSIDAVAGRSYCGQIAPAPTEQSQATPSLRAFRGDASTQLAGGAGVTRACFIAPASETVLFNATQSNGTSRAYTLNLVETTLWANWFYTGGDYSGYIIVRNTSEVTVNATVTWRGTNGASAGAVSVAIPAGGVKFYDARTMAPGVATGSIEIGHDGAPRALVGSATTLSPTTGLSFDTIAMQRRQR